MLLMEPRSLVNDKLGTESSRVPNTKCLAVHSTVGAGALIDLRTCTLQLVTSGCARTYAYVCVRLSVCVSLSFSLSLSLSLSVCVCVCVCVASLSLCLWARLFFTISLHK